MKSKYGPDGKGGFYASVHHLDLTKCSIEDCAGMVIASVTLGNYILTEDDEGRYGSILVSRDHKDVYVIPPEVMLYLLKEDLIGLNPHCGGEPHGTSTIQ